MLITISTNTRVFFEIIQIFHRSKGYNVWETQEHPAMNLSSQMVLLFGYGFSVSSKGSCVGNLGFGLWADEGKVTRLLGGLLSGRINVVLWKHG